MERRASASPTHRQQRKSDMSIVPFTYNNAFTEEVKLPERHFELFGRFLRIQQRYAADGKGGSALGFGKSAYNAAFVLSALLESNADIVEGKRVVELGCGPGLVAIAAALAKASRVLATDGDAEVLNLAAENFAANLNEEEAKAVAVAEFLWGDEEQRRALHGPFDVVLAADVAAVPYEEAYEALVQSLLSLVSPEGHVYLAYQRRHASEDAFFERLRQAFKEVEDLGREALHEDFRDSPISVFRCSRPSTSFVLEEAAPREFIREATEINNCTLLTAFKDRVDGGKALPEAFAARGGTEGDDAPGPDENAVDDFAEEDWK
eukprot:scaffold1747_cov251-Pinguiococcus_pyrenoidosus.AAC.21